MMLRNARTKAGVTILLCVFTFALFSWHARYETIAAGIVPNSGLEQGFRHWQRTPWGVRLDRTDGPVAILSTKSGSEIPFLTRRVPEPHRFTHVRVSAEIRSEAIVPGPEAWQRGAVIARSFDRRHRKLWYLPSEVKQVDGTLAWRRFTTIIPVRPETAELRLLVYLAAPSGTLAVRGITVDGVAEAPWFGIARPALAALWLVVAVWVVVPPFVRGRRILVLVFSSLAGAAILAATLAPQPQFSNAVEGARSIVTGVLAPSPERDVMTASRSGVNRHAPSGHKSDMGQTGPAPQESAATRVRIPDREPVEIGARKVLLGLSSASTGHMVAYAVFASLVLLAFPEMRVGHLFAYIIIAAAASEVLQVFTLTRTAQLGDVAMNAIGVTLGVGVHILYRASKRMTRRD